MRGVLQALGMWKRHWARSDGVAKGGEKGHMIPYLRGEMGNTLVDAHFQ